MGVGPCNQLKEMADGTPVRVAGVVTGVRPLRTKRGDRMAVITIEDLTGTMSATAFPTVYEEYQSLLTKDSLVVLEGRVKHRDRLRAEDTENGEVSEVQVELVCEKVHALTNGSAPNDNGSNSKHTACTLHIRLTPAHRPALRVLREILTRHPGDARLVLHVESGKRKYRVISHLNVEVSDNTQQDLVRIVGRDGVWLQ